MRLNVHVPDELRAMVKEQLPDLNVSALLQDALRGLLDCGHERFCCAACGEGVDASVVAGDALAGFWSELVWAWEPLVDKHGTAVGAAQVAKGVAVAMGVPNAERVPLPRPPRMRRAS